jgi:hypothetical protein
MSDEQQVPGAGLPDTAMSTDDAGDDSGGARSIPLWRRWWFMVGVVVVGGLVLSSFVDTGPVATVAALLLGVVIFRSGWFFLQSFATPPPAPPDPGTLRKVKLVYRCPTCGTEVRMTAAVAEEPEPPRHCMDDMELVSGME